MPEPRSRQHRRSRRAGRLAIVTHPLDDRVAVADTVGVNVVVGGGHFGAYAGQESARLINCRDARYGGDKARIRDGGFDPMRLRRDKVAIAHDGSELVATATRVGQLDSIGTVASRAADKMIAKCFIFNTIPFGF